MKKTTAFAGILCILFSLVLTACNRVPEAGPGDGQNPSQTDGGTTADKTDPEKTEIPDDLPEATNTLSVSLVSGTDGCWSFDGQVLTFSGLSEDTVCSVAGEFDGKIVIDAGGTYRFELELCGLTLYSGSDNPLTVLSGDKVTLTAKKDTKNYIYDTRAAVAEDAADAVSAAVYATCDLDLGGKGELIVISENNNGIHTKDDLKVKNLTLSVTCEDNALKGNDSVTVTGGVLTLVARSGDGIKTKNTGVSSKGNQRGIVSVTGGTVTVYVARDGIDAAYDVMIGEEAVVNIYTDRYSPYTEESSTAESGQQSNTVSSLAATAGLSDSGTVASLQSFRNFPGGMGGSGRPGGNEGPGGPGGNADPGGPGGTDGNGDKSNVSTKGIKAGNAITVSGGTLTVNSYDDALHADGGATLENGEKATGAVLISGGMLTLFSKDDAVHADGELTVSGGSVVITGSYEGMEGATVVIRGGEISVVSSDDGINATATSGAGITVEGGTVSVFAGGDGMDANSRTAYQGVVFSGGKVTIVSTSGGDSSVDTEQGYSYTGGTVLALCPANGMGNEALNCQNFASVGTKTTMNLSEGQTLSVKADGTTTVSVSMPCGLSALVVYLGSSSAQFLTE